MSRLWRCGGVVVQALTRIHSVDHVVDIGNFAVVIGSDTLATEHVHRTVFRASDRKTAIACVQTRLRRRQWSHFCSIRQLSNKALSVFNSIFKVLCALYLGALLLVTLYTAVFVRDVEEILLFVGLLVASCMALAGLVCASRTIKSQHIPPGHAIGAGVVALLAVASVGTYLFVGVMAGTVIVAGAGAAAWIVDRLYSDARRGLMIPVNETVVEVDRTGVRIFQWAGDDDHIAWEQLVEVGIVTTSAGPMVEDFFVHLIGQDETDLRISGVHTDKLIPWLQRLPGFDNRALIEASGSTRDAAFQCWQGDPGDARIVAEQGPVETD